MPKKASIIINNYNYGKFLKKAIDSALAQSYKKCEVIVVDDGSNDNSVQIIESYGSRIIPIIKQNGGQMSCYQAGFEACSGDVILFLDADDYLHPYCIERCLEKWSANTAKAHFYLQVVNQEGENTNSRIPTGKLDSLHSLEMMKMFSSHSTPPGSGNLFATSFIRNIFPVKNIAELRHSADSVPIYAAPFFGDVIPVEEILGYYRRHSAANSSVSLIFNESAILASLKEENTRDVLRDKSWREVVPFFVSKHRLYLGDPSRSKRTICYCKLNNNRDYNENYCSSYKLAFNSVSSIIFWNAYNFTQKIIATIWALLVIFSPRKWAILLIKPALAQGERKGLIKTILNLKGK